MSASTETPLLLAALLAPLMGAVLVMLNKQRPNVREVCSFVAAGVMFGVIISLLPAVLSGQHLIYHLFQLLPGVSITLRADSFSMVFALVASFLWVITVLYSLGYMRGLEEHAQTRFNTCFALALFGAMGCVSA